MASPTFISCDSSPSFFFFNSTIAPIPNNIFFPCISVRIFLFCRYQAVWRDTILTNYEHCRGLNTRMLWQLPLGNRRPNDARHCWSLYDKGARGHPLLSQVKQRNVTWSSLPVGIRSEFSFGRTIFFMRNSLFPPPGACGTFFSLSHLTIASLATQHVTAGHDGDLILSARTVDEVALGRALVEILKGRGGAGRMLKGELYLAGGGPGSIARAASRMSSPIMSLTSQP